MKKKVQLALIAFLVVFVVPLVLSRSEASSDLGSQHVSTGMTSANKLLAD